MTDYQSPQPPTGSPPESSQPPVFQPAPPSRPSSPGRKMSPLAIVLILSAVFFALFMVVSGALYMTRGTETVKPARHGGTLFGGGEIGVVDVSGPIMDSKKTLRALESFEEEDSVKAIVLRLNSPGGAVGPSQEIYEAVRKFKKPVVASMSSVAASGAYYIACGAKKVYANPGTITGSIGVIMEFANLEKLYEWAKIRRFSIKTGKFKDVGAEYREMTADERALLQGMVDDVLGQFKRAVSEGRKIPLDEVTAIADGRIFSGKQAKAVHLVDELGTFRDAVDEAAKMAGLKGKPSLVYPSKRHRGLLDLIENMDHDDNSESSSEYRGGLIEVFRKVLGVSRENLDDLGLLPPGIYWLWRGGY